MSTPDVRVRLTPEGIKEVIFALRQIEAESKKSRAAAAAGVGPLKAALTDIKALLPTLGLAAVVGGFLALTKAALNTADATGKMAQSFGATTEEISALTVAFRLNESSLDGLQKVMAKTTKVIGDVRNGSQETRATLQGLGIDIETIGNQGAARALETIAKGIVKIKDPTEQAAVAMKLFKDKSGELLPAIRAVGLEGIDPFIEKARELGVLIDDDLAAAADRANDAFEVIKIQSEGLATQFAAGLAPAIADAMETFSGAVAGDGVNGMKKFGEVVGGIIRFAVTVFTHLGTVIGARIAQLQVLIGGLADAARAAANFDGAGILSAFRNSYRQQQAIGEELDADIRNLWKTWSDGPKDPPDLSNGGEIDPENMLEEMRKVAAARQAAMQAALEAELKLQQEKLKSEEQAAKTAYDQGLLSLEQYFAQRRAIMEKAAALELQVLRSQRALLVGQLGASSSEGGPENESDKIKIRQQIAQLDAQIQQRQVIAARESAALEAERAEAAKQLGQELTAQNTKLLELENRRHEAFKANLDAEIQQIRELGARAGQTADEIDAQVRRLISARTSAFNFEEVQKKATDALDAFDRDADRIARDQQAGIITQLEGEQRLIELERERLTVLEQLAQQLLIAAEATGSDEQIEKARQFADSVNQIAVSYQQATDVGQLFRGTAVDAFQAGIESLLANASKIRSVGDAFKSLALTVVGALNKIAAELLAKQIVLAALRAFGGGGSAAGAIVGGFTGGQIKGYATGGDIRGPRLPIPGPDKIPLLGQEGEFILRKARVQEPGALDFLRAWNSGKFSLAQIMKVPRFASGGEVGSASGTPAAAASSNGQRAQLDQLRIVNVLDPELVSTALSSASGERTILNVIQKNGTAVRRLLGG